MTDRAHLEASAVRITQRRREIMRAAERIGGAFTVDELAAQVRSEAPGTGLATIYRAVAALDTNGWLERVGERGGSVLYARCTADTHHHHLVCTRCGRVETTPCPLEPMVERARRDTGFQVTSHEVTLYGICRSCAPGGPGRA